ncbi:hypothetical protein D9753_13480 [Streptomyces dangxiongensis]|uniref:Uncharacterized protein n=1 Tax=Streptomyces dangxiongensis TaxID=1442032 RepID=A0A3G2JBQ5_9ACTN|nr:hypothetical protein [Streptomyces dangxiongensis]AYN39763.1 hypothetical protein D9753_13480 [Streptomyces dangxiongensis]
MGERHSGEGPPGRRSAHPRAGATVSVPEPTDVPRPDPGFETRFRAALRTDGVDPEAEHGAVAAFRAARAAGAHDARTRARDDWRPGRPRRTRRSLRTTLSLALASLTLGGIAVAAIGSAGSGTDAGRDTPRPVRSSPAAPRTPAATAAPADDRATGRATGRAGAGSTDPATPSPGHPGTARDTLAHCRAYAQAGKRGGALAATAWQRLVTAAGGPEKVAAYCAARAARPQRGTAGEAGGTGATGKGQGQSRSKGGNGGGQGKSGGSAGGKR